MSNEKKRTGVLYSSAPQGGVNVRREPVVANNIISTAARNTQVTVVEEKRQNDGFTWYKVQYGNIVGWVRNDVIHNIREVNSNQPDNCPPKKKLTVKSDTWFKQVPIDSSRLKDEEKASMPAGTTFDVLAYGEEGSHYRVTLENLIKNKNTWYVFKDHVTIS